MFLAIETIINKALSFDAKSSRKLKELAGKKVKINIDSLNNMICFELAFDPTGIRISTLQSPHVDVTVRGPLSAFSCFALTKNAYQAAEFGLQLEGDIEIGQKIQALFTDLDIDWEEPLAQFTNDNIAHHVGNTFRTLKKGQSEKMTSMIQSITEYLQEEIKMLPNPLAVEAFYQDIENLRDRLDRSIARCELLEVKLNSKRDLES